MTNSSLGFTMLFGGTAGFGLLNDTWTFYNTTWHAVQVGVAGAPPGREYASLAESPAATVAGTPASGDVVLFGGEGRAGARNDTWSFRAPIPSGASAPVRGNWSADLSLPTPPNSYGPSMALDFNASRIILTEGAGPVGPQGLVVTWAYFHLAASLNASVPEINAGSTLTFSVLAGGGSPPYSYAYSGLPAGCSSVDSPTLACTPNHQVRTNVTAAVVDQKGRSTTSSVPIVVDPQGSRIYLRSEFLGMFYTGYTIDNTFGVDTAIAGQDPTTVTGHLGASVLSFVHESGTLWNTTVDMGTVTPGAPLLVEANFTYWSLFSSRAINLAEAPPWMLSLYQFPGAIATTGVNRTSGPWNDSYTVTISMGWSIGDLLEFALPSPGFAGAYSLIPGTLVEFAFGSDGKASLTGSLTSKPSITIGPIELSADIPGVKFSATVSIASNFTVVAVAPVRLPHVYRVDWNSVSATLKLDADFSTTIPLFPAETPEGGIGISLELGLTPSVAVTLVLGPSDTPGNFLGGLDIVIENLLVLLGIAFTVSLQAGITDVFELGGGGTLSLETLFQTQVPHLAGLWLNASVFAYVQLLVFKITWTFWSGTLYQYGGDPPGAHPSFGPRVPVNWSWSLAPRYYNTSAYNALLPTWVGTSGVAIQDVYPATNVAIGAGASGATIAYTSDYVMEPERQALGIDSATIPSPGAHLSASTLPGIPGSVVFTPALLGLPNGSLRAAFSSLPIAELAGSSPSTIPSYALETTVLSRSPASWSPPTTLVSWGFPISYVLQACGADGALAVLEAPTLGPGPTTPERLLVFDPASRALQENLSVVGMARVTGYDCTDGIASLTDLAGNVSFRLASTDAELGVSYPAAPGWKLSDISWVEGSPTQAALLYRSPSASEGVLYSPKDGGTIGSVALDENASALRAVFASGGYYLFAAVPNGVRPYFLSSTSSHAYPEVPVPGLTRFGATLASGMKPTDNLTLAVFALPMPANAPSPPTLGSQAVANVPALLLGALLAVLILAAVYLVRTGKPAAPTAPASEPETSPPPGATGVTTPVGPVPGDRPGSGGENDGATGSARP
jgi:hypothetical protein